MTLNFLRQTPSRQRKGIVSCLPCVWAFTDQHPRQPTPSGQRRSRESTSACKRQWHPPRTGPLWMRCTSPRLCAADMSSYSAPGSVQSTSKPYPSSRKPTAPQTLAPPDQPPASATAARTAANRSLGPRPQVRKPSRSGTAWPRRKCIKSRYSPARP